MVRYPRGQSHHPSQAPRSRCHHTHPVCLGTASKVNGVHKSEVVACAHQHVVMCKKCLCTLTRTCSTVVGSWNRSSWMHMQRGENQKPHLARAHAVCTCRVTPQPGLVLVAPRPFSSQLWSLQVHITALIASPASSTPLPGGLRAQRQ
jgi:hypothetical protein